jgi:hypothetical protein
VHGQTRRQLRRNQHQLQLLSLPRLRLQLRQSLHLRSLRLPSRLLRHPSLHRNSASNLPLVVYGYTLTHCL